ncbi:segregation/condensation protein A [bacterium]|nr:segregation/condensation protein A [bacterium]
MAQEIITDNFYMEASLSQVESVDFDFISKNNSLSHETDAVEILVNMAKTGKIDPWNIDISDIAEKYFAQILQMKSDNLKVTSRTLLFLAILLKLKSNSLVGIEFEQFESVDVDYDDEFTDDWGDDITPQEQLPTNNVISLNEVLERRTSTRLNRNRVVTLQDLIKQLEFYEQLDKKVALKNTLERAKRRVRSYANFSTEDIVNLAHDEYIKDSVDKLHENLIKIFESEERVNIQTLTLLGLDKISVYIGLLFLSVDTDYELVQDEFYSDVFVTNSPIVTPVMEDGQTA